MTSSSPALFHVSHRHRFLTRANPRFASHDFIYHWAAKEMKERLADVTRDFKNVLICGVYAFPFFKETFPNATLMTDVTPETLNEHNGRYDCILSFGDLHCANDLPGTLIQLRRALKPDGVFMAAFAGGETLHELRSCLMQAEINVMGGASPRIFPFVDKPNMAQLLQRAGFSLPVVDSEVLKVSYRDMFHLMADVRGMGESNCLNGRLQSFTPSRVFFEAMNTYQNQFRDSDGRIEASFEIIFVIGWAPHESQQKPAKPGSGQVSLTEIL